METTYSENIQKGKVYNGIPKTKPEKLSWIVQKSAYISLVRSILDYSAIIWDPYYIQDINKLVRVQKQAARFITGDYKSRESHFDLSWFTYHDKKATLIWVGWPIMTRKLLWFEVFHLSWQESHFDLRCFTFHDKKATLIHDLGLGSLQERRSFNRLVFFYKVVEGLVPLLPPEEFLQPTRQKFEPKHIQTLLHLTL